MADQSTLTCVSCENTFDPAPHGGFCPDCDTPHPDFERPDADGGVAEVEGSTDGETDDVEVDDEAVDAEDAADDEPEADVDDDEDLAADEEEVEPEDDEADEDDVELEDEDEPEDDEALDADEDEDEDAADDAEESAVEEDEDTATPATVECGSCGATVDASAKFCPDCGSELGTDEEADALSACPDCGTSVDDESFCPNCGTDLDAVRRRLGDGHMPEAVTLEVAGETYAFGDGDTFGRQDEDWLEALIAASGGREEVKYISGEHLEFSVEDDGVYVDDVSTNGTSLNGEPLDGGRAKLSDGDTLVLAGRADVEVEL